MATYKPKKKIDNNGTIEEILLPISSIDGLQTALDGKQASGSYATTTQVNAKYTKPSAGIPKSDLASAVQTSLGKADTAVQTEFDPTVPSWAKNATKPTYTKAEVGLGNVDNTADLDKPISTATQNALSEKVDKVSGKGLSTNDYTSAEKNKLAGLAEDTVRYGEQSLTQTQKSQARSNIGAGTSNFDGTWGSLSGKPNVVQSTGNSTSDVMSQNAVTNELNKKANSADLAQVATSGSYNDLQNIPTDIAKIGNLSNPNLLINPNFVINQRGQSEYSNTSKKYTVDRTTSNRSVITPLKGGGIKFNVLSGQSNPYIQQIIENAIPLVGKILTLSISIDGLKYSHTITKVVPSVDSTTVFYNRDMVFGYYTCNLQLTKYKPSSNPYSVFQLTFTIVNPNDTIINWWKLEIGSVATEFSPPSIAEELVKCQRYYQIRSNSYTIETNAIDRPIPTRVNGTTGTTTIDSVTYKYVDAEI